VEEVEIVLPKASTHCFVAVRRGATFVAFAALIQSCWQTGSRVLTSTSGKRKPRKDTEIAAESVWARLSKWIAALALANNRVFVTGHSLACRVRRTKAFADEQYNPALGLRTHFRLVRLGCEPRQPHPPLPRYPLLA
jgi:hypothetical protein